MNRKPEHLTAIEWRNSNTAKGIVDALVEIGTALESQAGDKNTGSMEIVIDKIDHILGSGKHDDLLSDPPSDPEYLQKHVLEYGRWTGYKQTLSLIRGLAEMIGD